MKRFGGESLVLCSFCCQGFGKVPTLTLFFWESGAWLYRQAGGTIWWNLYLSASFHRIPHFLQYSCCDMHLSSKTPSGAISSCQHLEYSTSLQHSCSPGATGPAVGFLCCFPSLTTLPATAEPQWHVRNVKIFIYGLVFWLLPGTLFGMRDWPGICWW